MTGESSLLFLLTKEVVFRLWTDDCGAWIATEWVFVATILVLGAITGLVAVRQAVISELEELANAVLTLNQSFSFSGQTLVPLDDTVLFGAEPIPNTTRDAILGSPGNPGNPVGANPEGVRPRAIRLAMLNGFEGTDPLVDPNVTPNPPCTTTFNDPNGQIAIGTKNSRTDTTFNTNLTLPWDLYVPRYNTVKVSLSRAGLEITRPTTVTVQATAFVDRDVIGFHVRSPASLVPPGTVPAIPVMPFAILSDSSNPPNDPDSWDNQIIRRLGPDNFRFNASGVPVPGSDGIPEITVRFRSNGNPPGTNGAIVAVGTTNINPEVVGQVATGITAAQLAVYDPTTFTLTLKSPPDNKVDLPEFDPNQPDLDALETAFNGILGLRRVWMLYDQSLDPGSPPAANTVRVVGFVAARVMDVRRQGMGMGNNRLEVTLQPTMIVTANALTDTARRNLGPRFLFDPNTAASTPSIFNPYIARIDIVQFSPLP
jgi:hypothetical protein